METNNSTTLVSYPFDRVKEKSSLYFSKQIMPSWGKPPLHGGLVSFLPHYEFMENRIYEFTCRSKKS